MSNIKDIYQCPVCAYAGQIEYFQPGWIERLMELIAKHSGLGFEGDLNAIDISELYGLYLKLNKDV